MPTKIHRVPVLPADLPTLAPTATRGECVSVPLILSDGATTTVHIAAYSRRDTAVRVAIFGKAEPLPTWCSRTQIFHAIIGGFFMRGPGLPVGEVWMRGMQVESYLGPWASERGALYIDGQDLRIASRNVLPAEPTGDLIQAGPRLVTGGRSLIYEGAALDDFPKTWRRTNDTDITNRRYPRAAIGLNDQTIWAVVSDGPHTIPKRLRGNVPTDAGLWLEELAEIMIALGATEALNLDGGGSSSLVYESKLINRPRAGIHDPAEELGAIISQGRPIHSAIAFLPR